MVAISECAAHFAWHTWHPRETLHKGDNRRYHNSTYDFIYWALNVDVIKAFMSKMKYKPDQFTTDSKPVHYYFPHFRKFHDAILFCTHRAKGLLSEVYEIEM